MDRALRGMRDLLPAGWSVDWQAARGGGLGVDGEMVFRAPDGSALTIGTEEERSVRGSAAESVSRVLVRSAQVSMPGGDRDGVRQPRTAPRVCGAGGVVRRNDRGVSLSAAGPPGLSIHAQGAERSPVLRPSTINRLDGPGASRVIRTLCGLDRTDPARGVRELGALAGVSAGTVSKVLPTLESYGAIERDGTGRILRRDRRLLIERWAQDYSFRTSQRRIGCTCPRVAWTPYPGMSHGSRRASWSDAPDRRSPTAWSGPPGWFPSYRSPWLLPTPTTSLDWLGFST